MATKKDDKKKSSSSGSKKDEKKSDKTKTDKKSSSSEKTEKKPKSSSNGSEVSKSTEEKLSTPSNTTNAVANSQPNNPQQAQICENCHTQPSDHFCIECNLLLCQTCDTNIHAVSAFTHHTRRNSWEAQLYRHPCRFHPNKYISYFCTTCDEPICADCRLSGPHQGAGHTVVGIRDAFYSKLQQLSQRIQGPLRGKCDALTTVAAKIEGDIERVHNHAGEIERATRLDYEGIVSRLKRAEGMLTAVCQQDLDLVRADIYAINNLMKYLSNISISDMTKNPADIMRDNRNIMNDMYSGVNFSSLPFSSIFASHKMAAADSAFLSGAKGFANTSLTSPNVINANNDNMIPYNAFQLLQQLPSLHAQIDGILARSPESYISPQSHVDLSELPTEARDRAELMSKTRDSSHKIEVKEELLRMAETEKEEAIRLAREELAQWESLTSKYANELKRVSMKCVFCGVSCDPSSVNSNCKNNISNENFQKGGYQTARKAEPILNTNPEMTIQDAMSYVGNSRHFFVKKM